MNPFRRGDSGGTNLHVQYFHLDSILLLFRVVEKKPKQRLLALLKSELSAICFSGSILLGTSSPLR
jgi:hypothetical protein